MKIAIVGATGLVGLEIASLLRHEELTLFDSKSTISFNGIDLAFFCVESEIAKKLIPKALEKNVICIDASANYRSDPKIPLVIPEINAQELKNHQGLIASPNCTTTLMLLPLQPLHKAFRIKRIVATTYQAISGAGREAMKELEQGSATSEIFPFPCSHNVFPHESPLQPSGYALEEEKMHFETRKILKDNTIGVSARCVRVPVKRVHSIALNVEFEKPFELASVQNLIEKAPGVRYAPSFSALDAAYQKPVFCGFIRKDRTQENTLELWVAGDQLLKGAALNMVQIAEKICLKPKTASLTSI